MSLPTFPHLPSEAWSLYLRDELTGASLASVESHLEDCPACRRSLEQADPSFLFRRLRELPLREDALAGLWEGVRAELDPAPTRNVVGRNPARGERFALLAGAAAVLFTVLTLQVFSDRAPADACTQLALSGSECRDLFVDVRFDEEPTLFVEASADLSELL
jgi:anti-sigma factor RsiW